jgi:hypothetical protein
MKKRTIVLAIAALMLATSLPFAAKAQDPFKNLTDNGEVTFKLPRQGKDIDVLFSDGTQKKLTWNGKGFNKVK